MLFSAHCSMVNLSLREYDQQSNVNEEQVKVILKPQSQRNTRLTLVVGYVFDISILSYLIDTYHSTELILILTSSMITQSILR